MNWSWLSFVVGLLVGWLIEWLIDFFYWRRRHGSLEGTNVGLRARLDAVRTEQVDLETQLASCLEDQTAKEDALADLQAKLVEAKAALEAAQAEQAEATRRASDLALKLAATEAALSPEPQDSLDVGGPEHRA